MKAEGFPIQAACEAAEISTSAYYEWLHRSSGPTASELDEAYLVNEMWNVHHHLDDSYGSPRMTDELRRRGLCVNHKRTERLMADNDLHARDGRRQKVRTTIPDVSAPPLPDLVKRDFSVGEPALRTCGDITYVPTDEGWLYLADVLDLGSRRIVGFAMGERMPTELVTQTMEMAIAARGGEVAGMVFHHDRGKQHTSAEYGELARRNGVVLSIGRKGECWDNAVAESFFATIKRELIDNRAWPTREGLRRAIFDYVEGWYNVRRLHSSLDYCSPAEWEANHHCQAA
jgi:transposase InsO family protein